MHCGKGAAVGQGGRNVNTGKLGEGFYNIAHILINNITSVQHGIDEFLHARILDAFKVIADTEIKDYAIVSYVFPTQQPLQDRDKNPCFDILENRLFQLQFLRPLGIIAFIFHIDTGTAEFKFVKNLHCLQFNKSGSGKPAGENVLRQLGIGPGGGTDRSIDLVAEKGGYIGRVCTRPVEQ